MTKQNYKILNNLIQTAKDWKNYSKNRRWLKDNLRKTILKFDFNRDEKYQIYLESYKAFTVTVTDVSALIPEDKALDPIRKLINKAERKNSYRKNKTEIKDLLESGRTNTVTAKIFYRCSRHNKPAGDHAKYQGKIYYDRFWESKNDLPEWLSKAIRRYIEKHGLVSVQKIIGHPVYLTTRPYCKHYFIPLDTLTVLTTKEKD